MIKNTIDTSTKELVTSIISGIQEKKGKEILKIDLTTIDNIYTEYFIICTGDSNRQVSAITDSIAREVKEKNGIKAYHVEGKENSLWVLMDYGNILVHIFQPETRNHYKLEDLWADGETERIEEG